MREMREIMTRPRTRTLFTALLLAALPLLAISVQAQSNDIYIPDNNPASGICNHFPFNAAWSGASGEWRYHGFFTAQQMGSTACLISDISFAPCSSGTFAATKFQVRLSHTTASSITAAMNSNLPNPVVVIPEGPFTWNPVNQQWTPLTIVTPFSYNGTDNVVVEIRYTGGTISGGFAGPVLRAGVAQRVYTFGQGAYNSNAGTNGGNTAFKIKFSCAGTYLMAVGTPRPGNTVDLVLKAPQDMGLPYQVGSSLGNGPIPIDTRTLDLSLDDLLKISVQGLLPSVLQRYSGFISATGQGVAKIALPNNKALVGVKFYSAFLTIKAGEPSNVKSISNSVALTLIS